MVAFRPTRGTTQVAASRQLKSDVAVGRVLREARERRRESLGNVAANLKIPSRHLLALEEGDLSVFKADVYARGAFIKYGEYLGVSTKITLNAFSRVLSDAHEFVPLKLHTPKPWLQAALTPRWFLAGAILAMALVIGGYIVWQVDSFFRLPALTLTEPSVGVVEGSAVTVQGKAEADAQVSINSETVLIGADGSFSKNLNLHPGINVIQVEATNAAGRTNIVKRDVLLPRQ